MKSLFFSLLLFIGHLSFAGYSDSLQAALKNVKDDTTRLFLLDELVWEYLYSDIDKSQNYAVQAIFLSQKSEYPRLAARAHHTRATVFLQQNQNDSALVHFRKAIKVYTDNGLENLSAGSYNGIGNVYLYRGVFEKSLENYLQALRILEKYNSHKQKIGLVTANIGVVYFNLENYDKSIEYYNRALKIAEETSDSSGIASAYTNLGNIYKDLENFDESEAYFIKAIEIFEKLGEEYGYANCCANLGGLAKRRNNIKKAMEYYQRAYEIYDRLKSDDGICAMYFNFGATYLDQKEYGKAIHYLTKSIDIARKIKSRNRVMEGYGVLHEVYEAKKDHLKAYETLLMFLAAKDSVLNEENSKNITRMQTIYETDKKEQELKAKQAELDKNQAELKQKTIQRNAILFGGGLSLALMLVAYRGYREKKKANIAITLQKEVIEQKNKDITDSINYAKRIQTAILPSKQFIEQLFPESFVLYQPRDIVSGDFYFFARSGNKRIAAVCDCTGHGVPGAFMSMIGNDLLNRIVNELEITDTAKILNELHKNILSSLNQEAGKRTSSDGMDISILCYDEDKKTIQLSGAVRPAYYVDSNGNLHEVKCDRYAIGTNAVSDISFISRTISLSGKTTIYLFSDGYADQFGGNEGKKFMTKRFKETLLSIQKKTMDEQERALDSAMQAWKKGEEQVDDILVVGIRI